MRSCAPPSGEPTMLTLAELLLIVVVLFGVGRLGKIGSELGRGIREFRAGLSGTTKTDSK